MTSESLSTKASATSKKTGERIGFGTFGGVFTPCTLTILGVIMFLRFGQVVGQAGAIHAILIVLAAKTITLLTTLSLSAIATNTEVKGGGAYFLISRSLGVEFGGAIGLVFFFAQAISTAMYVIGFSEALVQVLPENTISLVGSATIVNILVFICVLIGANWTIKLQYSILAILALSIFSFYLGAAGSFNIESLNANLSPSYLSGKNFFVMFALFFPAVTGIMAGANMSGDLRDPGRSIPRGTLLSIVVTGFIYLSFTLLLAGCSSPSREALLDTDSMVVGSISRWPFLITAGVFAATLSSALGSMMGAPRILQAFARDNVFKTLAPLGKGSGPNSEPRRAVVLTFFISQAFILTTDLDTIAPLITMAFLITYGLLNLATFYEGITRNPSYRPRFRFSHWTISLVGAIGCLGVMFLIEWRWATISLGLMAILHTTISRREVEARWGDLQRGLLFERTRRNLIKLEDELQHPKNWRPIIVCLSGAGGERKYLAVCGHWFTAGHGILTLAQIIQGEVEDKIGRRENQQEILNKFIRDQNIAAFPAVLIAPHLSEGIEAFVQCHGLGALRPNTLLFGWPKNIERAEIFGATLRSVTNLQQSIIAVRYSDDDDAADPWAVSKGTIDVWWRGHKNGELMLLLAHLLSKNRAWRSHKIRLLRVIPTPAGQTDVLQHLNELIVSSRIRAEAHVVISQDPKTAIQQESKQAAMVFFGFESPSEGDENVFFTRMESLVGNLPRVVFVDSIGGMSLKT